jgi:ComF family protein
VISRLRTWSEALLAHLPALIPSSCALCADAAAQVVCPACRQQFFVAAQVQRCDCCGLPSQDGLRCGACLRDPPAFDATIVATDYLAPVDQLVLQLKFGARLALAPLFGSALLDAIIARSSAAPLPHLLAPVPLSAQRLRHRGFNQALEIARPLARSLGIPLIAQLAERVRETRAQAGLPLPERQRNLRAAFDLRHQSIDRVPGQHIGIVDDVMTTGATLNELAKILKNFGAARVTNLVFARTLPR